MDLKRLNRLVEKKLTRLYHDGLKDRRVSVIGVFHNGKILMGQRRDNSKWTNPGGHLHAGEDPHTGALRELREETGIITGKLEPLAVHKFPADPKTSRGALEIHCYGVELEKPQASTRHDPDEEVSEWKWLSIKKFPDDVKENLHCPDNKLLKHLGVIPE